METREV
jgi:hypothetical protein